MKNFKVNEGVLKFDCRIDNIPMHHLEALGWDFDQEYTNYQNSKGISYDEAKGSVQQIYDICLWVDTNPSGKHAVLWGLSGNGDLIGKEDSGDTKSALNDIVQLLNNDIISIEGFECDDSTDKDGNNVPSFIEIA